MSNPALRQRYEQSARDHMIAHNEFLDQYFAMQQIMEVVLKRRLCADGETGQQCVLRILNDHQKPIETIAVPMEGSPVSTPLTPDEPDNVEEIIFDSIEDAKEKEPKDEW